MAHAPLILVAGPTASGKSGLAMALAEEFGGTIVNADSMQAYRDLRILTARPGADDEARVPHRLYGVIDAAEVCSAGRWRAMALDAIGEVRAAGRVPILVGGTGLYIEALVKGLAPVPPIPMAARAAARALHAELGGEAFRARLAALDPESAARLRPSDTQRLVRAYEVMNATGRTLGEWQRAMPAEAGPETASVVLMPPRAELYRGCDARLERMMAAGAEEEVRRLMERRLDSALPVMKAVGVREVAAMLAGEMTRDQALAAAQQATRRYAKRQYTWFRHRMEGLRPLILQAQYSESLLPEIFAFIRRGG